MKNKFTRLSSFAVFAKCLVLLFLFPANTSLRAQTVCDAHFAHYSLSNPDSLHFYPSATNAVSYSWSFGDGGTSSNKDPWHLFSGVGTYSVCLTVADSNGSTCTWCDTVHIGNVATCSAAFSYYTIHNPDSLHFYPNGSAGTAYYWNFGDGTTSPLQYPWHYYSHAGTYIVCLTVADTSGITCSKCDTVTVGSPSACSAAFSQYSINNPDSLHFYPTSTTGIASCYWNFGDGTTSTNKDPWHHFATSGTYNICLTVADSSGATCTTCDNVHVGPAVTCSAAFSHYSISNPDSMHFYPITTTGVSSYYWNFGDNTTSTLQYPWHYFHNAGTYYVCLTVADSSGATCTSCDTVNAGAAPMCSAAFAHYTVNADSVHFYPTGLRGISYYWSFGDGTTGTGFDPYHTYSTTGTYNVCLTVADSSGATCTWCDTVVYVGPNVSLCSAAFSHYSISNPDSLHFYSSGLHIATYNWNFGDGTTSPHSNIWHFYSSPGTYYVCLSVVDSSGATCSTCDTIHVGTISTTCNAQFSFYTIHNPDSLHFYPTGTPAHSYYWSFGDGTTSTLQYPWHFYSGSGTYRVCLYIADTAGVTCDWCDTVHVIAIATTCNAQFAHYSLTGVNADSVHFYPTGPHASSYYWTFGDGGTSTHADPWHYYNAPGLYTACLTVVDSNGPSCTTCDTVTITSINNCNAQFSYYTIHNPDSLHFYPTGAPAASYYWNFGDGTVSTQQYPWHYYTAAGTYYACLTVADSSGITCTHCDTVYVGPPTTCNAQFVHYSIGTNVDSVHFYSTGAHAVSYYWNFGDGTTSTNTDPWHHFSNAGTYYDCLTVADSSGVTCTSCDTVVVGAPLACSAAFSHYTGNNADSLHFYPANSNATAWYWSFGDSTTSTSQYPWHHYSSNGIYYVCLTVVDTSGATCSQCDTVHIGHQSFAEVADHNQNNSNPDSVQFTAVGSADAVAWYWDFGDGTYACQESPLHYYASVSIYYVTLTAADTAGAVSVSYDTVNTGTTGVAVAQPTNAIAKVYPNPMNEFAIVYMKNVTGSAVFRLYDVTGKLVYGKENLNDGSFTVNTRSFSAGVYFYTIGDSKDVISQGKLMVIH
jgi:PKD repeat protein